MQNKKETRLDVLIDDLMTTDEIEAAALICAGGPDCYIEAYKLLYPYNAKCGLGRVNFRAECMRNRKVAEYIQSIQREAAKNLIMSKEAILKRLYAKAMSDMTDFVVWDSSGNVSVKASHEIPKNARSQLKKIEALTKTYRDSSGEMVTESIIRLELFDSLPALKMCAEYLNLFNGQESPMSVDESLALVQKLLKKNEPE